MVGRLNGYLTPASKADAADVALNYVRANLAAFGLPVPTWTTSCSSAG